MRFDGAHGCAGYRFATLPELTVVKSALIYSGGLLIKAPYVRICATFIARATIWVKLAEETERAPDGGK
jgi:hypothetical protein